MRVRRLLVVGLLLPVAGYVIWDQIEARALARDIAAIAARGEPITVDEQPSGADTPERHDAARIYAAAAQRVHELPPELTFRLGSIDVDRQTAAPLDIAQLERTYPPDAPALQLLDQATPLDFNGFGDVAFNENNSPLFTLHGLAALRADLFSARGRGDAAAQALVACVRLRRTLGPGYQQAYATQRLLGSVRIMLHHTEPTGPALAALQGAVLELPDDDDVEHQVQLQRARFVDEIERPSRSVSEMILARLLRPWIVHGQRKNLASYADAVEISRRPWPEKYIAGASMAQQFTQRARQGMQQTFLRRTLRNAFLPEGIAFIGAPFGQAAVDLAARRVIVAALAVERYRRGHGERPPPTLEDLVPSYLRAVPVDPFAARPIVYRAAPDRYLLYSIDANRTDDGGAFYGFGTQGQPAPRAGAARDLGIRVDIRR